MTPSLALERLRRAADLPDAWEALRHEAQVGVARPVLQALEHAALPGLSTRYLVARRGAAVVAGAALHRVAIDLAAQRFGWAEDLSRQARRLGRTDLLRFRALMCGLNVSQGRDDVVAAGPPPEEVILAIAAHAEEAAEAQDLDGVVFGHIHPDRLPAFAPLAAHGYVRLPSLGYASLPIRWRSLDAYLAELRAGYRRQARADLARRDRAGVEAAPDLDLAAHAEAFAPLYAAVVSRAEHRIETLNAAFFGALAAAWPGGVELLGLRRGGTLVAGAVVARAGRRLSCLEVGVDDALREEAGLYQALLLALVERACALGVERLDLGQTALDAKTRLGAEVAPTWLLVKARSPLVAAALRVEQGGWTEATPERHVFRGTRPAAPAPAPGASPRSRARAPSGIDAGDYARHVNPDLAALLGTFRLDRTWVRGDGARLWDAEGREALDLAAGYGALPFGHNPRFVWDAVLALQASEAPQLVQGSLAAAPARLARALLDVAPPGLRYAVFASSGAEAVEVALKAARAARRRPLVAVAEGGFHGKTLGALSATPSRHYQAPFFAPAPGYVTVPYGDLAALERLLAARGDELAALLVEPIQGEAGVIVPPPGWLAAAREACARRGVLFLVDEVQTGLGRTGRTFACAAEGVSPDALLVSKALGGGLVPSAACLLSERAWTEELALRHSSTFAGNALAAAVGVAVLDRLGADDGELLAGVRRKGDALRARLEATARRCPAVAEVRGRGLMIGVELGGCEGIDSPVLRQLARDGRLVPLLCSHLLSRHAIRVLPPLARRTTLRLLPPLDVPDAALERAADALDETLERLAAGDARGLAGHLVDPPTGRRRIAPVPPRPDRAASSPDAPRWRAPRVASPAGRFAFLLHPLDLGYYRGFEPSLAGADARELAAFDRLLREVVDAVEISRVALRSAAGAACEGWFIGLPLTARGLAGLSPEEAMRWVRAGVAMGRRLGADVVGLGAHTAIVSAGGLRLRGSGVGLTTGNAYTVATALEALELGARAVGVEPAGATCAVVGASGAIGRAAAILLAGRVGRLVLVGNPAHREALARLAAVADEIRAGAAAPPATACTVDAREAVSTADLVVTATSAIGAVLRPEWLRSGSVVCDVAQPPDVSAEVHRAREDVLVLDGGVVALPEPISLGWDFGFPPGTAFACMAETMLLALEGRRGEEGLGARLDVARVAELSALAGRHGFQVAGLRRAGRPVSAEEIARVRAAASATSSGPSRSAPRAARARASPASRRGR